MTPARPTPSSPAPPGMPARVLVPGRRSAPTWARAPLSTQVEVMRRGGMSVTAIRRALGLSMTDAMAAGIVVPAPSAISGAAQATGKSALRKPLAATVPVCAARSSQVGPAMASVLAVVARIAGVAPARLLGPGQSRSLARPRHLTMYLLRALCGGASLPAIGHFLRRDHTTVLYGCRRAAALLDCDPGFRDWHDKACAALGENPSGHGQG